MTTEHITAEHGNDETAAGLQHLPEEPDEIEASLAALEQAMLRPPVRNREAIHELGCRIVAQAIMNEK